MIPLLPETMGVGALVSSTASAVTTAKAAGLLGNKCGPEGRTQADQHLA